MITPYKTLHEIYAETGGDKNSVHSYLDVYADLLAPYRSTAQNVLEIGVFRGESLRMWEQYFEQAAVYGVDVTDQPYGGLADLRPMIASGKHRIVLCDASNRDQIDRHFGDMLFDVVIDDGSHDPGQQVATYWNFRDKMRPGGQNGPGGQNSPGIYIIEDIADLDRDHAMFEMIDPERSVTILDRRAVKNRFDDVLVVIR